MNWDQAVRMASTHNPQVMFDANHQLLRIGDVVSCHKPSTGQRFEGRVQMMSAGRTVCFVVSEEDQGEWWTREYISKMEQP